MISSPSLPSSASEMAAQASDVSSAHVLTNLSSSALPNAQLGSIETPPLVTQLEQARQALDADLLSLLLHLTGLQEDISAENPFLIKLSSTAAGLMLGGGLGSLSRIDHRGRP